MMGAYSTEFKRTPTTAPVPPEVAPSVLIAVMNPSFGGHTRSAVAVATELRARGHRVEVLVDGDRGDRTLLDGAGLPVHSVHFTQSGLFRLGFERCVRQLLAREGFEGIHLLGGTQGVYELARAARQKGRFFFWTYASGGPAPHYFGLDRVGVFTEEVAADVRRRSPGTVPIVVPARLDFRELDEVTAPELSRALRERLGVGADAVLVVRVARCHPDYLKSIRLGIRLTESLMASGTDAFFLHVGFPQRAEVVEHVRGLVEEANRRAGRVIAASETTDVACGARYLAAADVCVASGRSALEALALGRATLLVWGDRYLGIVTGETIHALAETNFQGRRESYVRDEDGDVSAMLSAVRGRRSDGEAITVQGRCARFVRERYSVQAAVDSYVELYRDRRVRVGGRLRQYGARGPLTREIRRVARARWSNRDSEAEGSRGA